MPRQPNRISRIKKSSSVSRSRIDRAPRRQQQNPDRHRSGSKGTSVPMHLLGLLLGGVIALAILISFIYYWLIPRLILDISQPELILLVPKTIPENENNDRTARLLLMRLDPDGDHSVFQLSGETSVSVGQYGTYKLAMVYPLLRLDDQPSQYVASVFSQVLELPLDKVLALDPVTDSEEWGVLLKNQLKKQPTELLWWQLAYILKSAPNLNDPDNSTKAIAEITKNWPVIDSSQASKCPIAISNGAGVSGLATYTSNLIERSGGLVIRVATEYEPQVITSVVVDPSIPECQTVAATISRFFPSVQITMDTQNLTAEYRAKILVLLGKNMDSFTPMPAGE